MLRTLILTVLTVSACAQNDAPEPLPTELPGYKSEKVEHWADTCAGGRAELMHAEFNGREVLVPEGLLKSAGAFSYTDAYEKRELNTDPRGHHGCPGVSFPAAFLKIWLWEVDGRIAEERLSPNLLLHGEKHREASLAKRNALARRALEEDRCNDRNPTVKVCEVGSGSGRTSEIELPSTSLLFPVNFPEFGTGDPFFIACDFSGSCSIQDRFAPSVIVGLQYHPKVTPHQAAVEFWKRLRPLAKYYLNGGGASPPDIRQPS